MELSPTKLSYFDDMWALQSTAVVVAVLQEEEGRRAVILDATIIHPQGGGQPADHGFIAAAGGVKFVVEDVRSKDGVVYHYGNFGDIQDECEYKFREGEEVSLHVDSERRNTNSRLHSAGHLLDICMRNVGLSHLEAGKGYHFPDGPFVEYKGTIPKDQLQNKQTELEKDANSLISTGGKVDPKIMQIVVGVTSFPEFFSSSDHIHGT